LLQPIASRRQSTFVAAQQVDVGLELLEGLGDGEPDAGRAASDEDGLACEEAGAEDAGHRWRDVQGEASGWRLGAIGPFFPCPPFLRLPFGSPREAEPPSDDV